MARSCEQCSGSYESSAPTSRFCSAKCRKAAFLARRNVEEPAGGATAAAVRAELEAAGRLHTYLGAAALSLADRVDSTTAVVGFPALVKELRATMDAALSGAEQVADPLDELRLRRDAKRAG